MGETQAPAMQEVADSIVVADSSEWGRKQIMRGDVQLVVTITKGQRISRDTLENLETDVQAVFKRARKELHEVGEKILALGGKLQVDDDTIAKAVNCGVELSLWSTSVV